MFFPLIVSLFICFLHISVGFADSTSATNLSDLSLAASDLPAGYDIALPFQEFSIIHRAPTISVQSYKAMNG
jgi:hypothetical protein